jgi:hypothetical protein
MGLFLSISTCGVTALCVIAAALPQGGQARSGDSQRGRISGVVWDGYGAPLDGLGVALELESGQVLARQTTNRAGEFIFQDVAAGGYVVRAARPGLREGIRRVTVSPGQTAVAALMLSLGGVGEAVGFNDVPLRGHVLNPDGTPAQRAVVYLHRALSDQAVEQMTRADSTGAFSFAVDKAESFVVVAVSRQGVGVDVSPAIGPVADAERTPLTIELQAFR